MATNNPTGRVSFSYDTISLWKFRRIKFWGKIRHVTKNYLSSFADYFLFFFTKLLIRVWFCDILREVPICCLSPFPEPKKESVRPFLLPMIRFTESLSKRLLWQQKETLSSENISEFANWFSCVVTRQKLSEQCYTTDAPHRNGYCLVWSDRIFRREIWRQRRLDGVERQKRRL